MEVTPQEETQDEQEQTQDEQEQEARIEDLPLGEEESDDVVGGMSDERLKTAIRPLLS